MGRWALFAALVCLAAAGVAGQSVTVYTTTPDLAKALKQADKKLRFEAHKKAAGTLPVIAVDEQQRFQEIDGFGASLTDSAAWLFAKKLGAAKMDEAFKMLFGRKDGIALSFLRQPVGSSDLAVTFYSFDDLCEQGAKACTTKPGLADPNFEHFSLAHDQDYILPLLKKALELNPDAHVMLTPWSAPGWMKTTGSMLGLNPETKEAAALNPDYYQAFAAYIVKTVEGYEKAGVPVWALSAQNEPLFATPNYSGMQMLAGEQAKFFGEALGPALAAAKLNVKVMAYDHNWDHPEYPETVLKDARAGALAAGTAWHHYAGDPAAMTKFHEEFPQKDQWVTEASGGTWQKGLDGKGNVLAEEAAELIAVTRNWAKSYVLWAVATDQNHGPVVGGCDTCRGLLTIDTSDATKVTFKPKLDFYVLGQASKFLYPGAVRVGSSEPTGARVKDVAFRNRNGSVVVYTLNEGSVDEMVRVEWRRKSVVVELPAGSVTTLVWKP
jgi:glucosylceramidase